MLPMHSGCEIPTNITHIIPRLSAKLRLAIPATRSALPSGGSFGVSLCWILPLFAVRLVVSSAALISDVLGSNTGNL